MIVHPCDTYPTCDTCPTYTSTTEATDSVRIYVGNSFVSETKRDEEKAFKDYKELQHLMHVAERHAEQKAWWYAGFGKVHLYDVKPKSHLIHRRMMSCNRFD